MYELGIELLFTDKPADGGPRVLKFPRRRLTLARCPRSTRIALPPPLR
jgi:hypothetical protein